jgi:hypothetical protein
MRIQNLAVLVLAVGLSSSAMAERWTHVALVDTMCHQKVKNDPDKHTTDCALACAGGGYGILLADGSFLKLDKGGNDQAVAALKNTDKRDHLRATVTGERRGDTVKVQTLALE